MIDEAVAALVEGSRRLGWSPTASDAEVGPYSTVGDLAHYLVSRAQADKTDGFPELFRAVEVALENATAQVRDLLIVGLLEDLQNVSLNAGIPLEYWRPWLAHETQTSWAMLERFWDGNLASGELNAFVAGTPEPPRP